MQYFVKLYELRRFLAIILFVLTPNDIDNLAALARLDIPADEKETLRKEVDSILVYVSEIQKLSAGSPAKTLDDKLSVGEIYNVLREDTNPHLPGEFSEDLLAEAPRRQDNYIKVKKIL